jgi:UDP-3-O-[3-hydroxymyristoyl] N-acetylglucosamine deacetylase
MRIRERTISETVSCSGIGLHSGEEVSVQLSPAPERTGILFRSPNGESSLAAGLSHVASTRLSTTLRNGAFAVRTVEHLLSALAGLGIDNVRVTIRGGEIPIMDGSAAPFVALLEQAGSVEQAAPLRVIRILRPVGFEAEGKFVRVRPSDSPSIFYTIRFDHSAVAEQSYRFSFPEDSFQSDIAPARTFGFLHEVEQLKAQGLIRGGSIENALVLGKDGILNPHGLRFPDEFVRHKILDLIGDFALLGAPILGEIEASCSGHALHVRFLQELLSQPDAWLLEELREEIPVDLIALPT